MNNHFHLVLETPNADLVAGMRWLLSSYTIRLNHRHCLFGHVLSRRYKAVIVDGGGDHYLGAAYDYVHLNPVRGKLLSAEERLSGCPWSSLVWYAAAREHRPAWVRVDRLLGEHQIFEDTAAGRQEFGRCMEGRRAGEMNEEELTALLLGQWDRRQNLVRDFSPMATRNCGMIPWRSLANVCHDPHGRNNATTPTAKRTAKSVANPWSDGVQDALLSFLLLDPTALAATDPRPNYPTAFYDAPQGRLAATPATRRPRSAQPGCTLRARRVLHRRGQFHSEWPDGEYRPVR